MAVFKIETSSTKTDFNITMPDALKSIKIPGFINLSLPPARELEGHNLPYKKQQTDVAATYHTRIEELFLDIKRKGEIRI